MALNMMGSQYIICWILLYNPYEIILFGSCTRGKAREDSDIDICIVLDFESKRELLIDLTMKIQSIREIDFIVYTKSSWERNIMDTTYLNCAK